MVSNTSPREPCHTPRRVRSPCADGCTRWNSSTPCALDPEGRSRITSSAWGTCTSSDPGVTSTFDSMRFYVRVDWQPWRGRPRHGYVTDPHVLERDSHAAGGPMG